MRKISFYSIVITICSGAGCEKSPPNLSSQPVAQEMKPSTPAAQTIVTKTIAQPVAQPPKQEPSAIPIIDLKTATEGLTGTGALTADFETDVGKFSCKLFDDKAPKTVANFVGLARGLQPFQDPITHQVVKKPAYTGVVFHRIIKGFMIQGGDPTGTGGGDPGYVIPDELWPGATHDRAGLLCMANRGPNTNGMQFFITDAAAAHLDRSYTIFGECSPVEMIHKLADSPVRGEKPVSPPKIQKITIRRG